MIRAHDLGVKGEENIAKEIAGLGLDGVQLVAYKSLDGVTYTEGALTPERAKEVGRTIRTAGDIALVGAYFNPVHPNEEKRNHGIRMFEEYLSLAPHIGCAYVGSETGSYMGDPWGWHADNSTAAALDAVVGVFSHLADVASDNGVNLAIEGAFNHVCTTPARLHECLARIGRDNIRPIFDLYNYLDISNYKSAYDILDEGISLFGERILLFHIKDFTVGDGRLVQCGVGQGVLDFGRILRKINENNPDAILVLEGTTGADIPIAIAHLRSVIDSL